MANKEVGKTKVNKKHFLNVLEEKHTSIRKLGDEWDAIGRTERTIRRCLNEGEMPDELLDRIAKFLNVHPDYLSGKYNEKADKMEDTLLRKMYKSRLSANNYPYLLKAQKDLDYSRYFEDILTMSNISMEQFKTLPAEERVLMRQEMVCAIMQVIARHFQKDSLGYSIQDELAYCESMVGDEDPTSLFHLIEGIGITEEELFAMNEE